MNASMIILGIVLFYVIAIMLLGLYTKKFSKSSDKYMTGGKSFGPFIIWVLMMSEFIGTGSTLGTAQTAFTKGISASWPVILTTTWYMAGNPFGIDNIYIAVITPIIVMAINHLFIFKYHTALAEKSEYFN